MIPREALRRFEVVTFDCYGTLIDWEAGILSAIRAALPGRAGVEILERFAALETEAEKGPYLPYRQVLKRVQVGLGLTESPELLAESIARWKPFPDTVAALKVLKKRFKLAVITNIDDDLFEGSRAQLGVEFDWVVTAQEVGAYKPSPQNFIYAVRKMGVPCNRVLHAAQSLYHDVAPARELGLSTAWVNRRKWLKGGGATPASGAKPDLEVPDLKSLADLLASA